VAGAFSRRGDRYRPALTLAIERRIWLAARRTPPNTPATDARRFDVAAAFAMQAGEESEPCHPK
jgi:hypothetical protein